MIGRKKELNFLTNGLSPRGNLRCSVIIGEEGIGKSTLIRELISNLTKNHPSSLSMYLESADCDDHCSLLSAITRKMSSANSELTTSLHQFARQFGGKLTEIQSRFRQNENDDVFSAELAETFVHSLENKIKDANHELAKVTPVILIDDIHLLNPKTSSWFTSEFNNSLRKSKLFQNSRFIFTTPFLNIELDKFLAKLGIATPHFLKLPRFSIEECKQLIRLSGFKNENQTDEIIKKSNGNPSKLLNILRNHTKLTLKELDVMNQSDTKEKNLFSDFSEKELSHLLLASYPSRINRYNLEFFCEPREAAFCFNWLKRQKALVEIQPDGDLILNGDFRSQMRSFHKQEEPEKSEEMSNKATIIDAYSEFCPNPNQHWIPVNLHLFNSFTKDLCKKLFNEIEYNEIVEFLNDNEDTLEITSNQYRLKDDIKLVTQRFIEIGGGTPKENLIENAQKEWNIYQEKSAEKRNRLEQEKLNLEEESFDAEKQILSLSELKKQLLDDFKNPKKQGSKLEFSFSTSIILIVLGIGTVGLSLFVDSLGSYHAACGLAITLFGFFWPNIESKKQAFQSANNAPKLAIETQQRSLAHRISGLSSRVSSIHTNLESLNNDLGLLEQGMNAPYIAE